MAEGPELSRLGLIGLALRRLAVGLGALMALLLVPAGTLRYWEAWGFLAALLVPMSVVLIYLLIRDPALLARRLKAGEQDPEQGLVIRMGSLCYFLAFVLAGLDRRFAWSHVAPAVVIAADLVILFGYALFLQVLRANSYASRVIEVAQGQQPVTNGPYAVVRHPMYAAILLIFGAAPVALGSWWALLPVLPLVLVLVARIRGEERFLAEQLPGYRAYLERTRYRLVPHVW
ncbi:MAG: isoprenylcysteine carboxylmethyltransferase family protein [Gemmatimonadetes bacterium]|nr:isoprenylcysteine carboxylmethyltransferase family protein [Gemmatimonadota bacterium]